MRLEKFNLSIESGGIVDFEENLENIVISEYIRVELNLHDFGVSSGS
jgi:hypothetical protein